MAMITLATRNSMPKVSLMLKCPRIPTASLTGKYVLTPIQPMVIRNWIPAERYPPRRPNAERPEDQVDRADVGARPDPELLPAGGVPALLRDRLDAVDVEPYLRLHRFRHEPPPPFATNFPGTSRP